MIIFLNLDGTANIVTPERVFQGTSVSSIDAISAYPNATAMQVAFFLPSGETTEYAPMYFNNASSEETAGVWSYTIPFSVTQKQGRVGVAIMAILSSGKQTSYICDFKVEESVLPIPPPEPTPEVHDLILQYLARQQAELVNLDIRVTDLENVTVKRTMIDFTAEVNQGLATFTKLYTDGTIAQFDLPLSGSGGISASGLAIVIFKAGSWRDTGTMENPSGVYELAFAGSQVGQSSADFLASVARVESYAYESGAETMPTLKNGYTILSDKIFKGSDGSVLLTGVRKPYDGQLICYNGRINGDKDIIVGLELGEDGTSLTISYLDGSQEIIRPDVYTRKEVDDFVNNIDTDNIVNNAVTTPKIADEAVVLSKLSEDLQAKLSIGAKTGTTLSYAANDWVGEGKPYKLVIPKAQYDVLATGKVAQFSDNLVFGYERTSAGITLTSSVKRDFTIYIK